MPPIELSRLRPVPGIEGRTRPAEARSQSAALAPRAIGAPSASHALDPGAPPVDAQRVSEIRKAVENGTYPVVPARIADAMIAAGFLLRSNK